MLHKEISLQFSFQSGKSLTFAFLSTSVPAFLVAVILLSCCALSAFPQNKPLNAESVEMLKSRIKEVSQNTQTISSDFIQEKEMSMIKEKIISKGRFYFKKEKMLRWEYLQPFSYIIIIKNDQISIMDDDKVNQFDVRSNKVFQEINRIILGCIRGTLLSDEENFTVIYGENPASWIVTLKTRSPRLKASLSEIVIFFDRNDFSVSRLEMNEPGGDCTKINFKNKKLNQPVDDKKFMAK
jgi:outer membrane lipoprotein-sorting protein